jgi:hypothetical protein
MFLSLFCYFCHIHRLLGSAVHSPTTYPSTPYHLGRAARGVKKTRDVDLYRHQFRQHCSAAPRIIKIFVTNLSLHLTLSTHVSVFEVNKDQVIKFISRIN